MTKAHAINEGDVFGSWTVLSRRPRKKHGKIQYSVQCACGRKSLILGVTLVNGVSIRCRSCAFVRHGSAINGNKSIEYNTWTRLKHRVKSNPNYAHVTVDPHWLGPDGFKNFLADMGPRPADKTSIGRVDGRGPYSPANCRWEDADEQANNTSRNVNVTVNGVTNTVAGWARALGCSVSTLQSRHGKGMTWEEAVRAGTAVRAPIKEIARLKAILDAHGIKY